MFVTVTAVAAMLVMASSPSDNMELARKAYGNCVIENVIVNLDGKADESSNKASLSKACQDERKSFVAAIVQYERSEGSSATEAREIADDEVQMILEDYTESYATHLKDGTRPQKEV